MLISKTDLSALLSCFNWLFCIIDYFVNTECVNSYYPFDTPCNLFAEYLFQIQSCLHYYLALSSCSLLSTILSTLTLCNFLNPVDIPCNLFTKCLLQMLPYLHCLSCFHWLFCIIDYIVCTYFVKLLLSS